MIVIVTDSSAYLTREEAERLGAVVVPMTYSYGGSPALTETYVDENGAFDRLIDRYPEQMHTSQAPMSAFVSTFTDILEEGNDVLCITISSRMSGTYSNAVFAARELAPERICVVDSLNTAAGMYQLVKKARSLIDAGKTLNETAQILREMRRRIGTVFTVEDIGPLRRSGRIGSLKMSVSTILNIRPILRCADGVIVSSGIARGRNDQRRQLLYCLPEGLKQAIVTYYEAGEQVQALSDALRARGIEPECRPLGPVLAIHLGTGSIGLSWITED